MSWVYESKKKSDVKSVALGFGRKKFAFNYELWFFQIKSSYSLYSHSDC
jgi:hypothetical protein